MIQLRALAAMLIVVAVAGCSQGASSIPVSAPILPAAKATVAPGGATPSPSPTATPAPIGTPTVTPIPTATATATPAPTSTPVATPAPTATPTATATPAPTATPVATPAPTATPAFGPIADMPNSIDFTAVGAAAAFPLAAFQAGYAGPITESDTCAGIVTVSTSPPMGTTAQFLVTPVAPGACTITLLGGSNQTLDVPITVTTSGLVVSSRRKRT